ncbi:MAG: replication restart helicase PriA [bacterium]
MTVPLLIAVDAPLAAGDAALSYTSPSPLPPGTAVLVPLGARIVAGYVLGPERGAAGVRPLRPVIAALPEIPLLPADLLALARALARQYLCSVGEALAAALPPGLLRALRVRALPGEAAPPARAQRIVRRRALAPDALRRAVGVGAVSLLTEWVAMGTVRLEAALPPPDPPPRPPPGRVRLRLHPALWPPQTAGPRRILLMSPEREGTYLAAVADAMRRGVAALAIFASVDAAERFAQRVRDVLALGVTVLHGDLPEEERTARWLAVRRGRGGVIAGTRAAVFAPVADAGVVIVDEEGDVGHREERVPRYHAAEVARQRAAAWSAALILADEAPTVETFALIEQGDLELRRPPQTAPGPKVVIVDLRRPRADGAAPSSPGAAPILASPVVEAVGRVLRDGGRVVLFVHRKGFADLLVCGDCGYSPRCQRCDVSLAYDLRERVLRCRYCHDRFGAPAACPQCGGHALLPRGAGTQRVARLAGTLWPAPLHRLDSDVAPAPPKATAILRRFQREGGVLVATPLILAAESAPRADLVVIALADASLRHPDYRAPERGLRTLWRVRGLARSWCYVQTFDPEHSALVALRRGDLRPFYRDELRVRRAFHYPPYGEVVSFEVVGAEERSRQAAASLAEAAGEEAEVLGPAPLRRGRRSRWQVMLRGPDPIAREPLAAQLRRPHPGVRVGVDVNP